jgi:transcriptional regulator with XRE-family HTH domain
LLGVTPLLELRLDQAYYRRCPPYEARRSTSRKRGTHVTDRDTPSQARNSSHSDSTDADRLRALLELAGLSQRAAARVLNVEERTMRQWCAGNGKPPESVFRALNPRLTHSENLRRMIQSNERTIEAIQVGRITGMGYGGGPSDAQSAKMEIDRLRKRNEEHRALQRLDDAHERRHSAYLAFVGQSLPQGSGVPADETISELAAAQEEFRAAQAEFDRIAQELRGRCDLGSPER